MAASSYYGAMRATDTDREKVHQVLQDAYADGRLSWDEFDHRSSQLVVAKTYSQLSTLTADLHRPVPYRPVPLAAPRPSTNGLAAVSLTFGLAQIFLFGIGGIVAIICGHLARSQIRRTGQQGDGMAVAGLVLGYLGVLLPILTAVLIVLAAKS
ncbi:MAG TPA: DUF1707 and DUF4190 domain-containing protein [Streptosporangiaceae bacterium]|nr:DUF1707 and DUF4190 domain-containing protein [Streptosporangiaceae bacterium]